MKVTLVWPIGQHKPSDVVDVAPELGAVLIREGFARHPEGDGPRPEPEPPTVAELVAYATEHGITTSQARRAMSADLAARRIGAHPC